MDIDNKGDENENQIHGITMEKLSQLILDLKIREAQLQILIIFELLNLMHVEEQEFLTKNKNIQLDKEAQKSKNQSLVRRKRRKNKKKQPNSEKDILSPAIIQSVETEKQFQLFMSLTTYIDRLSLWDTLSVKSGGAGMYGFIGYVLVPYFHKKLPKLVEFVVESMKSLNMKLVSLKRKKSDQVDTEEHEQVDTEIEHGTTPQESDTPKHQDETLKMKPRSKYRKVLLDKNPPKLSKSTSIVDSDDFKPLISLKKSKSNLSAKHLSKREVDLNLKQSSKADFSSISTASLSFIFGTRAKKSLSASTVTTSRPTRTKSEKIATTPVKPKLKHSVSQIEATPAKARKVYMQPQVQATPVAPQQQPLLLLLQQQQQQRKNQHLLRINNLVLTPNKKQVIISRFNGSIEVYPIVNTETEAYVLTKLSSYPHLIECVNDEKLVVINEENKIFEFFINDKDGQLLTPWSKRNSEFLPRQFISLQDKPEGMFIQQKQEKLWIYGSTWLSFFDLSMNIPISKIYKNTSTSKKRNHDGLSMNEEIGELEDETEEIIEASLKQSEIDRLRHQIQTEDKDNQNNVDKTKKPFWITEKYRPIMKVANFGGNDDIIVVERPYSSLQTGPAFDLPKIKV